MKYLVKWVTSVEYEAVIEADSEDEAIAYAWAEESPENLTGRTREPDSVEVRTDEEGQA